MVGNRAELKNLPDLKNALKQCFSDRRDLDCLVLGSTRSRPHKGEDLISFGTRLQLIRSSVAQRISNDMNLQADEKVHQISHYDKVALSTFIAVQTWEREFLPLLDSGCSKPVLGGPGWTLFRNLSPLTRGSTRKLCIVANEQSCEAITVSIQHHDCVKVFEISVVPSIRHLLILGFDFWQQMGIVPNLRSGQWSFRADEESENGQVNAMQEIDNLSTGQRETLEQLIETTYKK
ncbi:hypothetical protein JTB14_025166 [Gonioctena quinquepunctata]|nr:hypothetical protein JTB14_025166 [Gonioctena quinquepunctata]